MTEADAYLPVPGHMSESRAHLGTGRREQSR